MAFEIPIVKIIDFGIATQLERVSQEVGTAGILEGSIPYISPEQTGRINRHLDYRSDFYSLGATLFELLTNRPLFMGTDSLQIIHGHIATPPPRADQFHPEIPKPVADIIYKLVSKSAEDRYQSAKGILNDFQRCLDEFRTNKSM